ncbi:hypothetical protein CAI21_00595 [Alkalilimnicola ehrlichii]|uniref:Thioredoxin domain-containing protein n=1 Tax=Alkalilimnicola ehrlichii TaxID=351052 RepID=A0A3E0X1P7_9GAMM|nr:hypothetical protein CAI21_00595 [Alkalilimnicola ehrlichii]RFA39531.1 hypothetical protein CAL65_01810 [Alkalilimnicola ehrlichii]
MEVDKATLRRNRIKLVSLAVLFFGPVILAWVLLAIGWRPDVTVNHGEFIEPPVPLATESLQHHGEPLAVDQVRGRWTIVHLYPSGCSEACLALLDETARVHVALNQNQDRARRLLIVPDTAEFPASLEADERLVQVTAPIGFFDTLAIDPAGTLVLVDPAGLTIMQYALPLEARGLLKDLERLMRASRRELERHQAKVED